MREQSSSDSVEILVKRVEELEREVLMLNGSVNKIMERRSVNIYAYGLGAQQGVNVVYRRFHVGLRDMERRSVHSYDPNSPNRRFIDKYRPGGDYE